MGTMMGAFLIVKVAWGCFGSGGVDAIVDGMAAKAGSQTELAGAKFQWVLSYVVADFSHQAGSRCHGNAACGGCSCVPTCDLAVGHLSLLLFGAWVCATMMPQADFSRGRQASICPDALDKYKTCIASSVSDCDSVMPVCC